MRSSALLAFLVAWLLFLCFFNIQESMYHTSQLQVHDGYLLMPSEDLLSVTKPADIIDVNLKYNPAVSAPKVMRALQRAVCGALANGTDLRKVTWKGLTLFAYATHDIVSSSVGSSGTWEKNEIDEMLYAMSHGSGTSRPLFVDIGANIGWFSWNAAMHGHRVYAFEAMDSNVQILQHTMCTNPQLMDSITLFGFALGPVRAQCHSISAADNRGNSHTMCEGSAEQARRSLETKYHNRYIVRSTTRTVPLDDVLHEDVQCMKLDTEGYELNILQGAKRIFTEHDVKFIMSEINTDILGVEGARRYMDFFVKRNYKLSFKSFRGPFINAALAAGSLDMSWKFNTLYCVHQTVPTPSV